MTCGFLLWWLLVCQWGYCSKAARPPLPPCRPFPRRLGATATRGLCSDSDVDNYINVLIEKIALDNACVHSRVATRLYETTVRTRILQGRGTKQKAVIFRRRIQRK